MPQLMRPVWVLAVALTVLLPAMAGAEPDESARIYQTVLKSVVWIQAPAGKDRMVTGSGTLIDKQRRLVLTNYHVVGKNDRVTVLFPDFRGTRLVAERGTNIERLRRGDGIRGRVLERDRTHDLAIVQLESRAGRAQAMALARDTVSPGQSVHSVGNPGDSGALWIYTPGKVRQVYHKNWKAQVGDESVDFDANVIETDSATNKGDSGGPLVNDKAQLVGVTQGGAVNARLLSTFIDVADVRLFLKKYETRAVGADPRPEPAPAKTHTFQVRDGGKFFGDEAIKKANDDIGEIARKYGAEVLIETFAAPPEDKAARVKEMTKDERAAFFKEWAADRVKKENVRGLYVLICRDPSHLYADVAGAKAQAVLDKDYKDRVVGRLLTDFRAKEFDRGLAGVIQMVRERYADPIANP